MWLLLSFASTLQARTRKLAEKRIPKAELEELERRRRAEEAEDRKGMVRTMRCAALCRHGLVCLCILIEANCKARLLVFTCACCMATFLRVHAAWRNVLSGRHATSIADLLPGKSLCRSIVCPRSRVLSWCAGIFRGRSI